MGKVRRLRLESQAREQSPNIDAQPLQDRGDIDDLPALGPKDRTKQVISRDRVDRGTGRGRWSKVTVSDQDGIVP